MAEPGMRAPALTRRRLLVGGGAAAGLVVAWAAWPRDYPLNIVAGKGETVVNAFLKIGTDGRVTVVVPQAEMGQGVYTSLPQILADELGADWRMVGVEPAPIHPAYINRAIIGEVVEDNLPSWLHGVGLKFGNEVGRRMALQLTGGSTSVRAFDLPLREAGATARSLLAMVAAARWGVDWTACEARDNQISHGRDRIGFGALAADAAMLTPPAQIVLRTDGERQLAGRSLPRLDTPAKVDGTAPFGADIRLPNMVFASVRSGPPGSRLDSFVHDGARNINGFVAVVDEPGWVAAVATNWWAAERALPLLKPVFAHGAVPDDTTIDKALVDALTGGNDRAFVDIGGARGRIEESGATVIRAEFAVPPVIHAPMETLTATARFRDNRLELWVPSQSISFTRAAVARALDLRDSDVVVYQTLLGGGFGRKIEVDAAVQAATIARRVNRPVQLVWSRLQDSIASYPRPPARARLAATLNADKMIAAWDATIATPSAGGEMMARLTGRGGGGGAEAGAVEGAMPPYAIPAVRVAHAPATVGVPSGIWRSVAHSYTAFFSECFVDELATAAALDPLSFRLRLLTDQPRHAEVLKTAASLGGYAPGSSEAAQGLALHACFGSIVAMMAEVDPDLSSGVRVRRMVCAADCGRIINPDIVRQQLEGGLIWGLAAAMTGKLSYRDGLPEERNFDGFALPILADMPEIEVHLIDSAEPPGGVGEIAVPPVAPAIANALFVAGGKRIRRLPIAGQTLS